MKYSGIMVIAMMMPLISYSYYSYWGYDLTGELVNGQ